MIKIYTAIIVALALIFGLWAFLHFGQPGTGTSLTTINGSDRLTDSRTTINDNFTALNTGKMDLSDYYASTSKPNLATIGTITTGVWNGTAVGVAYGGTGTTSPALNQVLIGKAGNGIGIVSGFGSSGQFLTSNGAGNAPTWQTSAVSTSDSYDWTGVHRFTAGLYSTASTTLSCSNTTTGACKFNTVAYQWPSADATIANKCLVSNAAGVLSWGYPVTTLYTAGTSVILASSTSASLEKTSTGSTKVREAYIAAHATGTVTVKYQFKSNSAANAASCQIYKNGAAFNAATSSTATDYFDQSENVAVGPNDVIQLYCTGSGGNAFLQRFFIMTSGAQTEKTVMTIE